MPGTVQLNEVLTPTYIYPQKQCVILYVLFTREHTHPLRQYRVGCVVCNLHEQVMPESCRYLTALHALSHPCLASLLFILSLYLNSKIFYLLVSFLFLLHNCAQVPVQKCIRFCGKRTRHRQVIDINNIYNFLLPEAVCCCVIPVLMKPCHITSVCQIL